MDTEVETVTSPALPVVMIGIATCPVLGDRGERNAILSVHNTALGHLTAGICVIMNVECVIQDAYRATLAFRCIYPCLECLDTATWLCTRCQEGKFGQRCDHDCSNCLYNKCYINGNCIEGCKSSWWGLKCDSKCKCDFDCDRLTGQFETNDSPCPQNCKKITPTECRVCNSTTRQCLHGCEEGFTGPKCQLTLLVGTEVSTVLPKPRSSCPPPCFQCSDNGTCLKCPGLNGEICGSCGQDGGCLDECGAGCVDKSNSRTESIVGDVPRDTWGQIDNLIQNNALLLPLLCCGLALIVIVTVGVTLKCSGHKRTQSFNMNSASIPEKQKEKTLFAKCGDIYHEIEDSQLNSHPLITPVLEEIPRQHSSREQGQGHFQKLHRPDDK